MKDIHPNYKRIVDEILQQYNDDESNRFSIDVLRHAKVLYNVNINTFSKTTCFSEEHLIKTFELFLASYFIDSALDLDKENQWNKPTFLFIGMKLVSEYKIWVHNKFGVEYCELFEKYYHLQWTYQTIERKWEIPLKYIKHYNSYIGYYKKQVILLFPILLLRELNVDEEYIKKLYKAFQLYYSIVLAIDDYLDIKNDIENHILTPIISKYYLNNKCLPSTDSDLCNEMLETKKEMFNIARTLEDLCCKSQIEFNVFSDMLYEYIDFDNEKIKI